MIQDLGTQAYSALRFNKRRSALTMLGMAWGIATVVLLLAYGSGFERGLMGCVSILWDEPGFRVSRTDFAPGRRHQGRK